jgi:hypothetical protein
MQESTFIAVQDIGPLPPIKREWLRLGDAVRLSGIGRSSLYALIKEGKVRSVCVRKKNAIRGIRIVRADSLRQFIESFAK